MTPATSSPTGGPRGTSTFVTPGSPSAGPSTLPGSGGGGDADQALVIEGPLMRKHDTAAGGAKASDRYVLCWLISNYVSQIKCLNVVSILYS